MKLVLQTQQLANNCSKCGEEIGKKMFLQVFKFYPTICKYNYLFKTKKMNCQPIFYQNYNSPLMNGYYSSGVVQKKKSSILNQLSRALKISFYQYCQYCLNSSVKINQTLKNIELGKEKPTICIEIQHDDQQLKEKHQTKKQSIKIKTQSKYPKIKQTQEKTDLSNEIQNEKIEANEIIHQSYNSNVIPKTAPNKNQKLNKFKPITKKNNSSVIIPKIDIVDTIQIKNSLIDSEEVAKKKKSLLLRNVENWNDATKGRKERRQIRMLKN